jgi:hypothetical protein
MENRDWKLEIGNWRLETGDWKLETEGLNDPDESSNIPML